MFNGSLDVVFYLTLVDIAEENLFNAFGDWFDLFETKKITSDKIGY